MPEPVMGRLRAWLHRPYDRCRYGHRMRTKSGYTLCRWHGDYGGPA